MSVFKWLAKWYSAASQFPMGMSFRCVFFAFFTLLLSLPSHSTSLEPLTVEDLLRKAWVVSYGEIVGVDLDPKTGIRSARFKADKIIHVARKHIRRVGVLQGEFRIQLKARHFPHLNLKEHIPLSAEFEKGEKVLLFLNSDQLNTQRVDDFRVVGMVQGKFRLLNDPRGKQKVLSWLDDHLLNQSQGAFQQVVGPKPALDWNSRTDLEDFVRQIERLARRGL